ncbi:angiopoietin-related protein 7-like isoform X2 [Drosophila sulfurigaster albostrigata]|uniref:angiopoietin-related protein 7-like isoform X2 n=1 Tax=Drosophila sulfurigaster albostrigata TaxID=89887 RepID=UPI002D21E73A|nr:angiopoietin-related protein 7-like isoform X2 [Drosophila sulfurigaster albostrigata]
MSRIILYTALFLVAQGISFAESAIIEKATQENELDEQCSAYSYKSVKPFIDYIQHVKDGLDQCELKNKEVKELKEKIVHQESNEVIIKELRAQIEFQKEIIRSQLVQSKSAVNYDELKFKIVFQNDKLEEYENQLHTLNETLEEKNASLLQWEEHLNEINQTLAERNDELVKEKNNLQICNTNVDKLKELNENSVCVGGIPVPRPINVDGYGSFDVLFDNKTAGPGWIVILQNINGKESFFRDWATYSAGFGSFSGDFFLGLEKIHQLTNSTRYELLIQMEDYDGRVSNVHLDNFRVDGKDNDYIVSSLGNYSGQNNNQCKYSKIDDDTDMWEYVNCKENYREGAWYADCLERKTNEYFPVKETEWGLPNTCLYGSPTLASSKMLIRRYKYDETNNK